MEITFLGTGAGVPSKERNVAAVALSLLQEDNCIWLFDCGEATQHQILKTNIKPRKINKVFISHLHGDHLFGLPGFLSSRSFQGGDELLTVYGPKGIKNFIKTCLTVSESHLTYPLEIIEFTEGMLFETKKFSVSCKKLTHGVTSYGFKVVEKDKLGELQVDKLRSIGISPGPIYREIKENEQTTLPDGQVIRRSDFIGAARKGKIFIYMGDTRKTELNQDFVNGADVLIHEATFEKDLAKLAKQYNHSTTVEAAELARVSNVKRLLLTHISSRYQQQDQLKLLAEAKAVFENTVIAYDLLTVKI